MRRSATVRALGLNTRPSGCLDRVGAPHTAALFCPARAALSLLLPARIGRFFAFLRARLNGAQLQPESGVLP
jgi:hypothetical protein